jgi:multidrug efflux pump subunit AcrA (membrane-fusion protein)
MPGRPRGRAVSHRRYARKLRIYVQVPEAYASVTSPGLEAELHFAEFPNKIFAAKTVRTSNALDPSLRTLQVELELDNANREVFPGAYAEVHFKLPASAESLRLPANTVLFRSAGLQVATVDSNKRVKLKSIVQGRDFGNTIEILSGLGSDEAVIVNPPDSLTDGIPVRIAPPPAGQSKDKGKTT